MENEGNEYSLHARLHADNIDMQTKESIITLSSTGENIAAKGIMGKIRSVAENILLNGAESADISYQYGCNMGYIQTVKSTAPSAVADTHVCAWTLNRYKTEAKEKKDEFACEELERSIVANLADDIIVGVRGKNVEITVKKAF